MNLVLTCQRVKPEQVLSVDAHSWRMFLKPRGIVEPAGFSYSGLFCMLRNDNDWLDFTYPLPGGRRGSEAERAVELELVCLRRLEAIRWPKGPECLRCNAYDASDWKDAPRGLGWRCRKCNSRFHVLQAIPGMMRTHLPVPVWFRAIFLVSGDEQLSSPALADRLGLEQKVALDLRGKIRQMQIDNPELVRLIISGPASDKPARRRTRKSRDAAEGRRPRGGTDQSDDTEEAEPSRTMPSAFEVDC
jgi:hypothetical protein